MMKRDLGLFKKENDDKDEFREKILKEGIEEEEKSYGIGGP